ncbi:uncharacterized protein LOC144530378 [Sander vitreus]
MVRVQTFPQGHIGPVVAPLSETVTTVQPINVQSKHSNNPPVKPINISNLKDSFHKSENQRTGTLSKKTGRECMTISVTIVNQSSPVEAKVHTRDCDLQNSNVSLDKGPVAKASKSEINTAQAIKTLVPNTKSAKSAIVQAKSECFTSKQTTTEAGLQATKTGTNIQTEITKIILTAEPEAKEGSHHVTHTTTTDPRKQTAAEVKKETETVILAQMNCTEGSIQAKNQNPAQVVSLSLKTPAETEGDKGEAAVTASVVSGSQIHKSEGAQGKVFGKEAVVKPSNLQVNIAEETTTLVPDTQSTRSASIQAKPESLTSTQTTAEASLQATKTGTHIQTEITKTRLCAEPEVKQESHFATNTTTTDPSEKTAAAVKKETTTVILTQMDCTEGYIQAKNQDPVQVVFLSLKTPAETEGDKGEAAVTASVVSGSQIHKSEGAQGKVFGKEAVVKPSNLQVNIAEGTTTLVPDTQSTRSASIQAKPESFTSTQTTAEASLQATKTGTHIQTEITKTHLCAEPEVKQESHFATNTTTTDPSEKTAAEIKKETTVISTQMDCTEGYIQAKNQDPAQVVSLSLKTPAETEGDKGEVAVTASVVSGCQILLSEEAQVNVSGELTLIHDTDIEIEERKGEEVVRTLSNASNIGKNPIILSAEPEVKQGSHFVTQATKTDPSKQTAAEVKKETEAVISAHRDCNERSIQTKNQDPAEVVSLSLETPAESVLDEGEVAVTASIVYGSHLLRSEEAQVNVSGELTLIHDTDIEREERKGEEVVGTLSNASNIGKNKVMKDADLGSGIGTDSHSSPDSNDNLESKTASTEILEKVEVEMNKGKAIDGFHDTNEVKVDPTEMDNEIVNPAGQEALLSTTKSKSLTETGMALSSSDHEMIQSPDEVHTFVIPTKPLTRSSPETCLSPDDTEVLMSMADQVFFPVDPEEHVISPGSIFPPNDPAVFLSPNDSDICFSPVDAKGCLSPNGEEDEELCLNLTEANADNVRQLEKYILSTKEEGQSLSSSRDQALPEVDINRKVSISVRDGNSLCIGSLEGNKGRSDTIINSGPTSRGIGLQLCSGLGVQNLGGSLGGKYGSEEQKKTSSIDCEVRGNKNSDCMVANKPGISESVFVKSASFGSVPANGGTTLSGMASDLGASFGGTAANSSGTVSCNAEATTAEEQGIFRRGSGDWMVYGSGLGRTSRILPSTGSQESLSGATSRPETGRFGRRGSGEGVVYGRSIGIESSLEGAASLPSIGKEEATSVATNSLTSPQEKGRFGSRGSGEWMVYGGSLGRKSSLSRTGSEESQSVNVLPAASPSVKRRFGSGEWLIYGGSFKRSDSLPNAESRESQSMTTQLPTSPPGTRRFGSRGSGEWRVYGGSTGRMSRAAGSDNLYKAGSEESLSVAMQLATSQPGALRARRFGSEDSGEWRVYGGSTGSLSSASNADRVSKYSQVISPPNSYTSSGQRLSSAGSGGRLSSGGVVRRSSSLGSGGRLSSSGNSSKLSSSSGNQRTGSSSGRFASTGSGESKPVYSSMSGCRGSGGGTTSRQRAPSPGGRINVGNGGRWSSSPAGGSRVSSTGSGSKLSNAGSGDRISSRAGGGRISTSSGSGRTNSTGGRVISSSDRPIRSTGSGAGGNKERISVCKMAALSIAAAGRQRSQDQQRQQQAAATSPRVQRWLTTGVSVTSSEPDGLDDIMRL